LVCQLKFQEFWSFKYTIGKVLIIPFQQCITCPQTIAKEKRKICGRLVIADQGGQKNRNGKMIVVLFRNVFY
jgi:hypothetical protein